MTYTQITSPRWANAEHTAIDCMVTFVGQGEVAYQASPQYPYGPGRQIFLLCKAGTFGAVQEHLVAAPEPTKEQRKAQILVSVGCFNEAHLLKDIFVSEGFAQIAGQTTSQAYETNVAYRTLIDARSAILAIEAEP